MDDKIEILKTANDYIDNIKKGIEDIVNKINSGNENNGVLLIGQVADGIDWLANALRLTKDIHKGMISINDMNDKLKEIIEALENEDFVLIGDLFYYELLPVLDNIQDEIKKAISN
jgi:hypothetical protein